MIVKKFLCWGAGENATQDDAITIKAWGGSFAAETFAHIEHIVDHSIKWPMIVSVREVKRGAKAQQWLVQHIVEPRYLARLYVPDGVELVKEGP